MSSTPFSFKGGREAEAVLRALGDSAAVRRAARAALRQAAVPMVATAKALAPKDVLNLENSIKAATAKRDKGDDGDQVAIVIGIDANVQPARYVAREGGRGTYRDPGVAGVSAIQEFGTPDMPANPYMRPSWDQHKDATPARVGDAVGPAVEKEAARLAKRAGRKG